MGKKISWWVFAASNQTAGGCSLFVFAAFSSFQTIQMCSQKPGTLRGGGGLSLEYKHQKQLCNVLPQLLILKRIEKF